MQEIQSARKARRAREIQREPDRYIESVSEREPESERDTERKRE